MKNCVFCKIAKKEIPANIVYEDEKFMAFLDIHPQSPGHCQIITKNHHRWVWDLPADEIGEYFKVAQKVALAQRKAFSTEWILSKIIGDEVEHAHIWIYPNSEIATEWNKSNLEGNAEKIKLALKGN